MRLSDARPVRRGGDGKVLPALDWKSNSPAPYPTRGIGKNGTLWHTHSMDSNDLERLRAFRQAMYTTFGRRRDALVEILDARLATPAIEHPVHLSLAPGFQRSWGSIARCAR